MKVEHHKIDDRALRRVYIAIETLIAGKPVSDQIDELVAVVIATLLLMGRDEKISIYSLLDQYIARLQGLSVEAAQKRLGDDEAERLQ